MTENIEHEFFIWEEKNLIEPQKNYENKIANEDCGFTTETKNDLTQKDWRDITDPKLRRKAYKKTYNEVNKAKIKIQNKTYKEANKDRIKEKYKAYYEANKDKIKLQTISYREYNKDKVRLQKKAYRVNNKSKIKIQNKAYKETNKDKIKLQKKAYAKANRDKIKVQRKAYYEANKDKIRVQQNNYSKNRLKTDIQYKLSHNLRSRLCCAIDNNQKTGSAIKDLGCTIDELKTYLESKFLPGMTWENWTIDGWHIDHIKPLASFDLTNKQQFLEACHYTNLQPMWAKDNLIKSDKII